ncbi:peptide chain release factor N(5)-glutamine methyltransferase [Sedimentibacter sp. B4]|uniref:peptide chain release factor N(5)-glutamine methyltransferase n=1 Tax=Sedimentibacter sp. B4 TaxID=304766 RepID=UPI0003141A0D|nr:peptide chain release factor N(5)-glutamine methyltransferase [Sedimentibacter sp. B4]
MVTIEKLLKDGIEIIKQRDYNNPYLDVQLILCHLLKKDRVYVHLNRKEEVDDEIKNKFLEMVYKRNQGYPLQYMTNVQEFMGLEFFVQEGILVPRPDTEILVEKIINLVKNSDFKDRTLKILDIGTGSGAIAVSLAYYVKNSFVTAVDVSETAISTTEINIEKHNLKNIRTVKADIFEDVFSDEKFDIVVSNPPYIRREIIRDLPVEVSEYEPKLALDGGEDGLLYYRRIAEVFYKIHGEKAVLCVEIGHDQKQDVERIFENLNIFKIIETDKDLGGNDRVVTGFL